MRRTGRRWRRPKAKFGEKVCFRKIGQDGVSSFACRMTQGIFVGHHHKTGALLCITKNGVVRGISWTRQTWDSTKWDRLCGTPWQKVAPELKLTKKVTADDKEGVGPPLPRIVVERRLNLEDSTFCLRTLSLTYTLEVVGVELRLHRMAERQSSIMTNAESESERSLREP